MASAELAPAFSSEEAAPPPAIRKEELLIHFEGDTELMGEITSLFLADLPHQLRSVQIAIKAADAKSVAAVTHSLKGALGNFSAKAAVDAAVKLGIIARDQNLTNMWVVYETLETALQLLKPELMELCAPGIL